MSAVIVHVSHAYKNMDMAREVISLILELVAIFLSFQMTFSLVTAAVVWAILENASGLDPVSDTIAPRYLKLHTNTPTHTNKQRNKHRSKQEHK